MTTPHSDTPPPRILLAKLGLDGHDRGVKVIARALRDAGMAVLFGVFYNGGDLLLAWWSLGCCACFEEGFVLKVKAAVLWEVGQPLDICEVDLDEPKAGEVLVKVGSAGICRSDRHFMHGDAPIAIPVVLGHEGAGTVVQTGPGVTLAEEGDRVILSFVPACGRCRSCLEGHSNLCDLHGATGANMLDGTTRLHADGTDIHHMGKVACFAEYAVIPETGVVPVGNDLPLDKAAMIGCSVTTGVGAALYSAEIKAGSTVAVIGCGGVGLNVIMGAALANAGQIIAVDIREAQLEFAMRFGATHMVNAADQDPVRQVRELTGGRGADYTFEVFGSGDTTKAAYDMAAKRGIVTVVGIAPWGQEAAINAVDLVRNEKTLRGSYYGSARSRTDMPVMVDLYQSGKLNLDDLVVRHYTLDQINEAYADLDNGEIGRGAIMFD